MSDSNIEDAVEAMLQGNRLRFGEIVADLMADKADAAVAAFRDDYAPIAFEDDIAEDGEEVEGDEEEVETEENQEEEAA